MKKTLLALALVATASPLFASDSYKLVARINGREITNADLDALWERVPEKVQAQYKQAGGKKAFLENYVAKKLVVQDAVKSGFAAKIGLPDDLDAAAESSLFDRYVREVLAAPIVTEEVMRKVYEEKRSEFAYPEQAHISIIRALKKENPEAAREALSKVMIEVFSARTALAAQVGAAGLPEAMAKKFAEVATRASDDPSASRGGNLGFVALHTLEPKIASAARTMKRGTISGILESRDAFQMVLVHEYRSEGVESYEAAQPAIREFIMARESKKVMDAVMKKTAELRAAGKVEIFAENLR
ncbi:MAG TPA: peptidylprolyl isomerase [Thermoanaerobaculia bacterium]|jgi:parvulin-like peptidyl-prolyl isomerase|nr:peptidylprolyl isomerase [Thermoanaerobaculia bacterium]